MIKITCREKHVYSYSPAESTEVCDTANDLKRLYDMQGYTTKIDISTVTITVTATRIIGVEEEKECANIYDCADAIKQLPSAERVGKWIDGCQYGMSGTYWYRYCSECGYIREDDDIDKDSNYCPNCGAKMKGEE